MAWFNLVFAFVVGLLAGAIYFAALWYTVRWLAQHRLAPMWLLISTGLRLVFLVAVLFWVMDNDGMRLLAALAGFLAIRFGATWPLRRRDESEPKGSGNRTITEAVDATDPR